MSLSGIAVFGRRRIRNGVSFGGGDMWENHMICKSLQNAAEVKPLVLLFSVANRLVLIIIKRLYLSRFGVQYWAQDLFSSE